ncbi:hypothetical protein ACRRTK_002531 [Alexandromys fortis]
MESAGEKPQESVSDMDLPSSTSDAPMAANGPVLMVKTKAALKQYPPYKLHGKAHKRRKHGKHSSKKNKRKRKAEETAALKLKKIKVKLVTAMPAPQEEEPAKQAKEEHATGEPSVAAAADEGESQLKGYREDGECPHMTNKIALV